MRHLTILRFGFLAFARVAFLIAAHTSLLLALVFVLTNHGRRVSFGTYQCFGGRADLAGFLFLIVATTSLLGTVGVLAYLPINMLLRLTGGLRVMAAVAPTDSEGAARR